MVLTPEQLDDIRRGMAQRQPPGLDQHLAGVRVGVAGCGGLGSHAAHALARLGIPELLLVDFDRVEPSNLNRQAYGLRDLGRLKTRALAAALRRALPFTTVKTRTLRLTAANTAKVFADCPVVLECLDHPGAKAEVTAALLLGLPSVRVVAASGLAGLGDGNELVTRRRGRRLWVIGDGVSEATPAHGLAAPRVMAAAGLQALVAARILTGLEA